MTVPTGADLNGPPVELPDPTTAPTPEGFYLGWWPAMVDVPGMARMPRARAYATPDGLYLWTRKPSGPGMPVPDVWLPIMWEITDPLPSVATQRVQGVYLPTEVGLVHITPTGGCGCGSPLRRWVPPWASSKLAGWPAGQQLGPSATTTGSGPDESTPDEAETETAETDDTDPPQVPADTDEPNTTSRRPLA